MASLEGPRAKIGRAKKHFADLDARLVEFGDGQPYDLVAKVDPDTGYLEQCVVIRQDPPTEPELVELALIAGDTIHNLRSALDLLYWQLIEANNKRPTENDAFPVSRSQRAFEDNGIPNMARRISKEAVEVVEGLKPYRGGNPALWMLHRLDIVDKHRTLITTPGSFPQVDLKLNIAARHPEFYEKLGIDPKDLPELFIGVKPADRLCPLKDGDVVFRFPADQFDYYKGSKIILDVAIHEPGEGVECESLLRTVGDLGGAIHQIVELFAPLLAP